jgi:CRP-like cAMP-binding protein
MLDREEIKQLVLLSDSYVLSALDDNDRLDLAVCGEALTFRSGDVIVRQGEAGDAFFLVKVGRVRVSAEREGRSTEVAVLGRGMCFGEMALLCGTPRSATVGAAEDCEVVRYRKSDIDAVLARNPALRQALDVLARRRGAGG